MNKLRKIAAAALSAVVTVTTSFGVMLGGAVEANASGANPFGKDSLIQLQFKSLPSGVGYDGANEYFVFSDENATVVELTGKALVWQEPPDKSLDDLDSSGAFDSSKLKVKCTNPGVDVSIGNWTRTLISGQTDGAQSLYDSVVGDLTMIFTIKNVTMDKEVIKVFYDDELLAVAEFGVVTNNEKLWAEQYPIYCNDEMIFGINAAGNVVKRTDLTRSSTGDYTFTSDCMSEYAAPIVSVGGKVYGVLTQGGKYRLNQGKNNTVTYDIAFKYGPVSNDAAGMQELSGISAFSCKATGGTDPSEGPAKISNVTVLNVPGSTWSSTNEMTLEIPIKSSQDIPVVLTPMDERMTATVLCNTQDLKPSQTPSGGRSVWQYSLRNRSPGDSDRLQVFTKAVSGSSHTAMSYVINLEYTQASGSAEQLEHPAAVVSDKIYKIYSGTGEVTETGNEIALRFDKDYENACLKLITTEPLYLMEGGDEWYPTSCYKMPDGSWYSEYNFDGSEWDPSEELNMTLEGSDGLDLKTVVVKFTDDIKNNGRNDGYGIATILADPDSFYPEFNNALVSYEAADLNKDGKVTLTVVVNTDADDVVCTENGITVEPSSVKINEGIDGLTFNYEVRMYDVDVNTRQSRLFEFEGVNGPSYALVTVNGDSSEVPTDDDKQNNAVMTGLSVGSGDTLTPAFKYDTTAYKATDSNKDNSLVITAAYQNGNVVGSLGSSLIDPITSSDGQKTWAIDANADWTQIFQLTATDGRVYNVTLEKGAVEPPTPPDPEDSKDSAEGSGGSGDNSSGGSSDGSGDNSGGSGDSGDNSGGSSGGSGDSSGGSGDSGDSSGGSGDNSGDSSGGSGDNSGSGGDSGDNSNDSSGSNSGNNSGNNSGDSSGGSGGNSDANSGSSGDSGETPPDENFEVGHIYSVTCIEGTMVTSSSNRLYTMLNDAGSPVVFEILSLGPIELRGSSGKIEPEISSEQSNGKFLARYSIIPNQIAEVAERLEVYSAEASAVETHIRVALKNNSADIGITNMRMHIPYDILSPSFSKQNLMYTATDESGDGKIYLVVTYNKSSIQVVDSLGNTVTHNGVLDGALVYLLPAPVGSVSYFTVKADATGEEYLIQVVGNKDQPPDELPDYSNVTGTDVVYIDVFNQGDSKSPDSLVINDVNHTYHQFPVFLPDAHKYVLNGGEIDNWVLLNIYGLDKDKMPTVYCEGQLLQSTGTPVDPSYVNSKLGTTYTDLYVGSYWVKTSFSGVTINVGPYSETIDDLFDQPSAKQYTLKGMNPKTPRPISDNNAFVYPSYIRARTNDIRNTAYQWARSKYVIEDYGDEVARFAFEMTRAEAYLIDTSNQLVSPSKKTPAYSATDASLPQTAVYEYDIAIPKTALQPYLLVMRRPLSLADTGSNPTPYSVLRGMDQNISTYDGGGGVHNWENLPYCDDQWFYSYIVFEIQGAPHERNDPVVPPPPVTDVLVSKVDADTGELITPSASFVFYKEDDSGKKFYYTDAGTFVADSGTAKKFTTTAGQFTVPDVPYGVYYIAEMDAPTGYIKVTAPLRVLVASANKEVEFENTKIPEPTSADLTVLKVDADTGSTISSGTATFQLYKNSGGTTQYYQADGTWGAAGTAKVFSTSGGSFRISNLEYGTYYLKELSAPAGYDLATTAMQISHKKNVATVRFSDKKTPEPDPEPPKPKPDPIEPPDKPIYGESIGDMTGNGDGGWPDYDPDKSKDPKPDTKPDPGPGPNNTPWDMGKTEMGQQNIDNGNSGNGDDGNGKYHGSGGDNNWKWPNFDDDNNGNGNGDGDGDGNGNGDDGPKPVITPSDDGDGNGNGGDGDGGRGNGDGDKNWNVPTGGLERAEQIAPIKMALCLGAIGSMLASLVLLGYVAVSRFKERRQGDN